MTCPVPTESLRAAGKFRSHILDGTYFLKWTMCQRPITLQYADTLRHVKREVICVGPRA